METQIHSETPRVGLAKSGSRKSTISARVYRAATGKWEDHGVIARSKVGLKETIKNWLKRLT